ncbi:MULTISPECIES: MoaF-related domain-containing protein [Providencia]|nr:MULTISPECIES: hypothetical protein [Providencia]ATG17933.1 hypothetical protein CO695_17105 [Providencia alcalifaciens]EUD08666.1 hypothetical protein HMPREF1564_3456 [Providencia alcalifaciens R90-1475]MBF0691890.1 hypothetical protein [Providencia alcalifaciens]MTB67753.1 hypothetical protein [Providencia sp. wls1943]MTC28816.1 hypothetical protein [Providencia alcalifaciens]
MTEKYYFLGKSFEIEMDNGLQVKNTYTTDGKTVTIEFLNGDLKGSIMHVPYTAKAVDGDNFLISWQESDNSTVVHCDNFLLGKSYAYYTMMNGQFFVMEGVITELK